MQNLDAYFKDKGFFLLDEAVTSRPWDLLEAHAENHLVRLRISERYPHLGILHYKDEVVFGKGQWTPFAKACRGVIVDFKSKKIIAKPFSKFFNLFESHAPSLKELEKRKGFTVMEKLDGSMILTPYDEVTDTFFASTKGSIDSEQGIWATSRIPESIKDRALLRKYTLIWEMISKEFQIVIPYDKKAGYEEGLYLIGVRENTSEKLFQPNEVHAFAKEYGLKTFKTYEFPTLQSIVDNAKELPFSEEGFVIRFPDEELQVKVKSSEYLRVHRFVSNLSSKNILDILIAGEEQNVYDNVGLLPEEYRGEVLATMKDYQREALDFRKQCYEHFAKCMAAIRPDDLKVENWKRKSFATEVLKSPPEYRAFLFKMYDSKDPSLPMIYTLFRKR